MNRKLLALAGLLLPLLLAGCGQELYPDESDATPLPPCQTAGTPFADQDFATFKGSATLPLQQDYSAWRKLYRDELQKVVDAHEKLLFGDDTQQLTCDAATYQKMLPGSDALKKLAGKLPAFKQTASQLSEMDIVPVLLEWERVYECSLNEEYTYAEPNIDQELAKKGGDFAQFRTINIVNETAVPRRTYIESEMLAVRALNTRLDTILGGLDRLTPLAAEVSCLERATADIRNSMSLIGEASACLPRALDDKNSLRDFDFNP